MCIYANLNALLKENWQDLQLRPHQPAWVRRLWATLGQLGLRWPRAIRVMTDCSGMEAPLLGLQCLGVPFVHVASCDISESVRLWIRKHHRPQMLFSDMLARSASELPEKVDLYVCGFPCTPFSTRRTNSSRFFEEPAARVFFKTIETILHLMPKIFVLENVAGILRESLRTKLDHSLQPLHSCYKILFLKPDITNPTAYGFPIQRPRVYIVGFHASLPHPASALAQLILQDVVCDPGHPVNFVSFLESNCVATPEADAADSGPCNCTLERSCPRHPCHCGCRAEAGRKRKVCRWRKRHRRWLDEHGPTRLLQEAECASLQNLLGRFTSPRVRHLLDTHVRLNPRLLVAASALDVSQSIGMTGLRCDGIVPTITCQSRIVILGGGKSQQRGILSVPQMAALMGADSVLREIESASLSLSEMRGLRHMLGNTMHVAVVGSICAASVAAALG